MKNSSIGVLNSISQVFEFIGKVGIASVELIKQRKLRWCDVKYYFDLCGTQSLPIVLLICFLMGLILAFQSAIQLQKFGTEIFVADLVGFSVLKEFGPFMVAIIAIGRAGSSFAAEIGTMKVNEEISALSTMGISPERFLILPKLIAMLLAMPMLTIFGDVAGLFGGFIVGVSYLDLPMIVYFNRTCDVLDSITLLTGISKSIVFAILITISGCYYGFKSQDNAQGVGLSATRAVVISILLVVLSDAIMTMLYSFVGY